MTTTATFAKLFNMEITARLTGAKAQCGMTPGERAEGARQHQKAKDALYAGYDALSMDEMRAYGDYRREQLSQG